MAGREATRSAELDDRKMQLTQRLWYDAPYGQVSSDGEAVFLLDELRFAPANSAFSHFVPGGFGGQRNNPNAPLSFNQLVALDLRRQGALRWMVGGETGLDEPKLAGAFFLGPPLPLFGQLYALAELAQSAVALDLRRQGALRWMVGGETGLDEAKLAGAFFLGPPLPLFGQLYVLAELNAEIRLVVLDATDGAAGVVPAAGPCGRPDHRRQSDAAAGRRSPSFADGVLVCPTSAGAVVAVDIATRSLLWGYQYAPMVAANRQSVMMQAYPGQILKAGSRWLDGTITLADGCVLLTPPESDRLCCLDLLTGQAKWPPRDRTADSTDWLYLACVDGGNAILVGRDRVTAVRLADGQPAWLAPVLLSADQREMPSGRGYYSERHYYLPTTGAQLLKIDLEQGRLVERTKTGRVLGNLVCYQDQILAQGVDSLAAHYQIDPLRQQVAQRLAGLGERRLGAGSAGRVARQRWQRLRRPWRLCSGPSR